MVDSLMSQIQALVEGSTIQANAAAAVANDGFQEASQFLLNNALQLMGWFQARRAAMGPGGFAMGPVMNITIG